MGRGFLLSLQQLGDRPVLAVLAKSLGLTLLIFAALGIGYWYALDAALRAAAITTGGAGLAMAAAIALAFLTGWLLFRIVAIAVVGIFAEDVVEAVERRHFPAALASARPVGVARSMRMGLVSGVRALGVNLLILPLYLVLLVTGVGAPLLFLVANGWLLGRDLGDMVAVRHLPAAELPRWRRDTGVPRFVLGLGIAAMLLVPILGLLAPVLGAAMATHLFHRSPR